MVGWFIHPIVFMAASTLVVIVLYRREFCSAALDALRSGKVFEEPLPGKPSAAQNPKAD